MSGNHLEPRGEQPAWAAGPTDEFPALDEVTYLTRGARARSQPDMRAAQQTRDDHAVALRVASVAPRPAYAGGRTVGRHRRDAATR